MRLDGKLLTVAIAGLMLMVGVALAEEPANEEASPAEQSEEMAAEPAEAKQSEEMAEAEAGEAAQADESEEVAEAEDAESASDEKTAPAHAKSEKPAPAETPAEKKMAAADADGAMSVSQIAICEDVQERTPVGESESFSSEVGQLWCFTRVKASEPPAQIFHRWYINENLVQEIAINVGGHHWRCWSTKTIDPSWTGNCRVEILTEEGDVISTKSFVLGG